MLGMAKRSDLSGGISLRFTAAAERAHELAGRPLGEGRPPPLPLPGRRFRVVGDPQTSLERFLAVLDAHELLGVDGFLADDVVLVSIGDHFDYPSNDGTDPRHDGVCVLRWLAEHSAQQVHIILGNHDAARVMELSSISDADFAKLRTVARELDGSDGDAARARWAGLTTLATPGLAARDYASFSEAQRALVVELLKAGRYRLGVAGVLPGGEPVLCTHAGVTVREVEMLGVEMTPASIAAALDRRLRDAVARSVTPLDLAPLHHAGEQPHEGGGLLYHRPADPEVAGGDRWESERRRRFHPRELPPGLVQVCGHTNHAKAKQELRAWATQAAASADHGALRTLTVDESRVVYDLGVVPPKPGAAVLYLIDAGMNDADLDPELVPLFDLDGLR
jgi:hypothetical protein